MNGPPREIKGTLYLTQPKLSNKAQFTSHFQDSQYGKEYSASSLTIFTFSLQPDHAKVRQGQTSLPVSLWYQECVNYVYVNILSSNPVTYCIYVLYKHIQLVGFGLACAPVRCAHPSFSAHQHT